MASTGNTSCYTLQSQFRTGQTNIHQLNLIASLSSFCHQGKVKVSRQG